MNLRDALHKAGKIDDKQKRKGDKEQKAQQHQSLKQPDKKEEVMVEVVKTAEEIEAEAAQKRREKVKELIVGGMVEWSGRRRFYFVARTREILFLQVSDVVGYQLEQGQAAIVEDGEGRGDHFVVTQDAALKVQGVDREAVRFFQAGRG
jgi:hypothetical protein